MNQGANQKKYWWKKEVNFVIYQWNHGCQIII